VSGFPIRTSAVLALAHSSPQLFAVYHVLLRHLTPRHPPYALLRCFTCDTEKLILSRYFTYASVNYTLELLSCARCHPPAVAHKPSLVTTCRPATPSISPSPPTKQPGIPGLKRSHPKYRYLFYVITSSINFVFNPLIRHTTNILKPQQTVKTLLEWR
jgi:hypothetical protein